MSNLLEALMQRMLGKQERMDALSVYIKGIVGSDTDFYGEPWEPYEVRDVIEADNRHGDNDVRIEVLGTGHFSLAVVYEDDPSVVYKIGLKKEDSGAAYAAWCRANPGPHVPVIHEIRRYSSCYIVKLDRYYAVDKSHEMEYMTATMMNAVLCEKDWHYYYYYPVNGTSATRVLLEQAYCVLPGEVIDTLRAIRRFFDGVATFDLHTDNVMWSSLDPDTRRLIITDPVSFRAGYD